MVISTHAPAGGATRRGREQEHGKLYFYSRPCGRGDRGTSAQPTYPCYFYSRPCGRGDRAMFSLLGHVPRFLLTPLREGRLRSLRQSHQPCLYFYSRPCGRGDRGWRWVGCWYMDFYSRPCGRGDSASALLVSWQQLISTHAPAGGATAIFHKSVMRFCGKLPKDDTVLCLASFGFPRRDPKAVYLAWISCANLPQKCVREGLALKDQGTSCFHEGLASHAFDPVLV